MAAASTYTVSFRARDPDSGEETDRLKGPALPVYKVWTCPPQPVAGEPFRVIVLAAFPLTLAWPYGSPLETGTAPGEEYSEALDLSGRTDIDLTWPATVAASVTAINPIVDADGVIRTTAGAAVSGAALRLNKLRLAEPRWGTVRVDYTSPDSAWWEFEVTEPGEYRGLLSAPGLPEEQWPELVPIVVRVSGDEGIDVGLSACEDQPWTPVEEEV